MAAPKKNEVAKKDETTTAMANYDYGESEGQGFDNQTQEDLIIPFLNLLQKGSPLVEERDDAKAGMIYNTVTEELFESVELVPVLTRHECVEWVPREKGGGFVDKHPMESNVVRDARSRAEAFNELTTPQGNELQETFTVFCITCAGGEPTGFAVIPFASTKIKVYKKYISRLRMFTPKRPDGTKFNPPLFAHLARLGAFKDKNQHGDFWNFTLEAAINNKLPDSMLAPDDPRFKAGKDLYDLIKSGAADADYGKMRQEDHIDNEETPF
jgi:hypothetical protein